MRDVEMQIAPGCFQANMPENVMNMADATPIESAPAQSPRFRPLVNLALIYLCCLGAVVIVYHRAPITFFRAETGSWILIAHSSPEAQSKLVREFWTTSSLGHYIPLAFTAEFIFTKWADTGSWLWRARQQGAVALVAAAFFIVVV